MEISAYVSEYHEICREFAEHGLFQVASDVAIAILQERGRDRRQENIAKERAETPASERQRQYLKKLGVEAPEHLTKVEASVLIDQHTTRQ